MAMVNQDDAIKEMNKMIGRVRDYFEEPQSISVLQSLMNWSIMNPYWMDYEFDPEVASLLAKINAS